MPIINLYKVTQVIEIFSMEDKDLFISHCQHQSHYSVFYHIHWQIILLQSNMDI